MKRSLGGHNIPAEHTSRWVAASRSDSGSTPTLPGLFPDRNKRKFRKLKREGVDTGGP